MKKWSNNKPVFKKECILIVATKFSDKYEYTLYTVEKVDGYNDKEEACWYWGLICDDGEEWGDIEDLKADLYLGNDIHFYTKIFGNVIL